MQNQQTNKYVGYWIYDNLLRDGYMEIRTRDINKENWHLHYNHILNLIKDYIETDYLKTACIVVIFDSGKSVVLGLIDFWYNVIMWNLIIIPTNPNVGRPVKPSDLFYPGKGMTRDKIKEYIDNKFIDIYRTILPNKEINNIIDDTMYCFLVIDEFAMFLSNTINLEYGFIKPAMNDNEFKDILNLDLSEISLEDSKNVAMKATDKLIYKITNNKQNVLYDYFVANECIRKAQFSEFAVCIAQKPDGYGGIYPVKIQTSLINGGVKDLVYYYIESSTGRTAQIVLNNNIGKSGYLARLLGLNTMDTCLHDDPHYACNTKNFIELTIGNKKELNRYIGRYYRFDPEGKEYKITRNSNEVIGKKIYLRSPMTCASRDINGVCFKCYGDLAYTNRDINIGKYASETTSSEITQKMLSAKHLLKAAIRKYDWNSTFEEFFDIDLNMIGLRSDLDIDLSKYYIVLNPEHIVFESEEETLVQYNKYVDFVQIEFPDGTIHEACSDNSISMYFTQEFEDIIDSHTGGKELDDYDEVIKIPLSELVLDEEITPSLFIINIINNELSDSLKKFNAIINKKNVTNKFTLSEMLSTLNSSLDEIGLNVASVHLEVIIANQIRNPENLLLTPQWDYKDVPYTILWLSKSLEKSPSITKTLSFQSINKMLISPSTYKKVRSSKMDLFFMEKPQKFLPPNLIKEDVEED